METYIQEVTIVPGAFSEFNNSIIIIQTLFVVIITASWASFLLKRFLSSIFKLMQVSSL